MIAPFLAYVVSIKRLVVLRFLVSFFLFYNCFIISPRALPLFCLLTVRFVSNTCFTAVINDFGPVA